MKTHGWSGSERPKFSLEERIEQRHQARLRRLAWRDQQRGWGKKFAKAEYQAAIPACCKYQTMKGHERMLLCWGLCAAIRAGKAMDCSHCDLATRPVFFRRSAQIG